jgi:alpha-glucosidase
MGAWFRAGALVPALLLASDALAGWTTLGAFPPPQREGASLVFRGEQGGAVLSVLAPEVVRVRVSPGRPLGRDHSYAVVARELGSTEFRLEPGPGATTLATPALRVTVHHAPFRVEFATADGESLDTDDPELGTAFAGSRFKVWKRLRPDEHVYGLGEKVGRLDKRGWQLGGYSYAMWNSDTFAYDSSTDPIYAAVPFYIVLRNGRAHGLFLDNTHRVSVDVGHEAHGLLALGSDGGELDYYFIDGPTPKQVIERYTALTGRMPLPPLWALGYHQCRYSYYPESRVRFVADNFRERRIPADAIWLDIHYMEGYRPFSFDRERFPEPKRLFSDLRAQGFRAVVIVDPHPKKQAGTQVYDEGLAGSHFVRAADGSVLEAPVWPSQAEKDPGPSVFPDFSRPATRDWWGGLYRYYTELGVAGIWNDMNEPALFVPRWGGTMPLDARHDNEGAPSDHREVHNVYGQLMTRSTYEGLLRLRPRERPFVLTRATYAGGQRFAAVWPGDNTSDWSALSQGLAVLLGMGLSGFPFVGTDIGGFAEAPSAELFTRWLQVGVFHPFMRAHTAFGTPDQEPWSYGPRHEQVNRRAIELRYELLPHVYQVMKQAADTGLPAMRPMFLEFPDDAETWSLQDQFLFGDGLLVAPVLREAATERGVYLPAGEWYDFWTGARLAGKRWHRVPVALDSIPIYVRAGAFVFRQPVVQHTGEIRGQPLLVTAYPGSAPSEAVYYEDDGESLDYRQGAFAERRFAQRQQAGLQVLEVAARSGSWSPAPRELVLRVRVDGEPSGVRLDGKPLARLAAAREGPDPSRPTKAAPESGYALTADGFVEVVVRDRAEPITLSVETGRAPAGRP